MQLIDIIFNVLLFGGLLLVIVIIISYIFSKSRGEEVIAEKALHPPRLPILNYQHSEQSVFRNQPPNVVQLVNNVPKELKIVRKPTVTKREPPENLYEHERIPKSKTNTNGKRYTIVNDEMQKSKKPHVVNFYL